MLDFKALSDKTYFITHAQGIKQFHKLEATADGIQLYVCDDSNVEPISYSNISYIISENKLEYFGVADNFIQFLKTDLADAPMLFNFMLTMWNEDYSKADKIFAEDDCITNKLIRYMQALIELGDYTALLSVIFANYLRYKNNKPT